MPDQLEAQGGGHCNNRCVSFCDAKIAVHVTSNPSATLREIKDEDTTFVIDLDYETDAHCQIVQAQHKKNKEGCTTGCRFIVKVDKTIRPKIRCDNHCKTTSIYELDVVVPSQAECEILDDCPVNDHDNHKHEQRKSRRSKHHKQQTRMTKEESEF